MAWPSKSQYRLKIYVIITNIKVTVQITYKITGNLWFISSCKITFKFGGIWDEDKYKNDFTKLIMN